MRARGATLCERAETSQKTNGRRGIMRARIKTILVYALTAMCVAANQPSSLAQSQNVVEGGANGAGVNVTATVLLAQANVSVPNLAPVTLPAQGGSFTNQAASANIGLGIPGVLTVLSTGLVVNSTSGAITQTSAHAESASTINNVNILNGLVTAATVRSKSASDSNGASATSTSAGSFVNQLRIAGVLHEQSEFAPNTTISISATVTAIVGLLPVNVPVNGSVIINEQTQDGNGTTSSGLSVNFLHVNVSGSVAGLISLNADIIVASASSAVNFTPPPPPPTNNPPALNTPGAQTVQAGSTLTFNVSASDPDAGDSVTLAATGLPAGSIFTPNPATGNPASGQFNFTPSDSQANQTFTVNFTATDSHGASVTRSMQIAVTPRPPDNRPPVINVPGPQTVEAGKTLNFIVTATDPDGDAVTLSATGIPLNASFNPASGQFSFTPSASQANQTFTVTFTATDSRGASVSGSVQLVVTPPPPTNTAPTLTVPGPQAVQAGSTLTFTVSAGDSDAGDIVILQATSLPAGSGFIPNPATGNPASGQFSFTPSDSQANQTFTVNFTATDSHGASVSRSVQISVTLRLPDNRPPIISLPGSQTIGVGRTLNFTVTASDPDGDAVTLSASSIPPNALFIPATGIFTFTPVADQAGQVLTVVFDATDSKGASAVGAVEITVVLNPSDVPGPPVLSLPPSPIVVKVGDTLTFTVAASSPSLNCQVSITASGLPDHAGFEVTSGRFIFTPTADQKDKTFVVTFTANDCIGQKATGTVAIMVIDAEDEDGPPQQVCVPVTKIFFGPVAINSGCGFVIVSVANAGGRMLRINSLSFLDGTHFRIEGVSGLPVLLQSGSVLQLKIVFQPKSSGTLKDTLTITTDDPEKPTITIQLKGKARR